MYRIVTMTTWLPDISKGSGPLYVRLADRIEDAIIDGTLPPGTKLPPQRNLAFDIGVTIGTIGRAYSLIHERGLVSGEVGRGTYVLDQTEAGEEIQQATPPAMTMQGTRPDVAPSGALRFDTTAAPDSGQAVTIGRLTSEIINDHPAEIASYTRTFPRHWFEAGAQWLTRGAFVPEAENVVPTLGAHAAIMAVLTVATSPGDKIVFEHLTYSQIARSANLIGRRTVLANIDEHGMIPEDFESVCAQQHPKIAFLMPAAHNPTAVVMPVERRRQIAEIARKYNVWLIEDDLYGSLCRDETPRLVEFAPERTFLIGGLSKSVAAGVRGGWVACPPHYAHRVRIAHKMITGGMPFLFAELCARLVLSGEAADLKATSIAKIMDRQKLLETHFPDFDYAALPGLPFFWLKLPEPWLSGTFKNAVFNEGILVDDEDEFKPGRSDRVWHRIRVGFSSVKDDAEVERGFKLLRQILENGTSSYDSYS
jgi:DNA-binding transcriptional MocR family regulator